MSDCITFDHHLLNKTHGGYMKNYSSIDDRLCFLKNIENQIYLLDKHISIDFEMLFQHRWNPMNMYIHVGYYILFQTNLDHIDRKSLVHLYIEYIGHDHHSFYSNNIVDYHHSLEFQQ